MPHLLDQSADELRAWLAGHGEREYRAGQVQKWLYEKRAATFDEMTDLPKPLRDALAAEFRIFSSGIAAHRHADDGTEKLLLELADGQRIECVLLREQARRTICISTQVGCAMGCVFCASGLDGVARNLTAGEIVEQMLQLARLLPDDERLSHIVVMGMGEPLANLDGAAAGAGERQQPRRGWASARGGSRSRPSACRRRSTAWPRRSASTTWPCRCTRPTTSCATSWCR